MSVPQTGRKLRTFIVDDHHDIADGLAEVLRIHGHEAEVAYTGEQAVRVFREKDFDIAFMDVMMPGMNGVESFLAIRRMKPNARVVMMTGYSVEQLLDQVVEKGAYGVLHKPVAMDDVLATLERVSSQGLVLIADSNPEFGSQIQGALEKNGYRTSNARTGKEALAKVLDGGVDILVLGQSLPVLSGLEVYMELRKRGRGVPTIIVTDQENGFEPELEDVYKFTTTGILTKPFNTEQLLEALGRLAPGPHNDGADSLGQPDSVPAPEDAQGAGGQPTANQPRPATASPLPMSTEPIRAETAPTLTQTRVLPAVEGDEPRDGRILAVDDDVDLVEGLADVLRTRGYEVRTANSAVRAHEIMEDFEPEVALLDIRLGKSNGLDLITSLKEIQPDMYCVMITGNADKESAITALKRGAFNYLTKPLHPHELFAVLENCFDKYFLDQKMREAFFQLQTAKEAAEANTSAVLDFYGDICDALDPLLQSIRDSSTTIVEQKLGAIGAEQYLDHAKNVLDNASRINGVMHISNDLAKARIDALEVAEEEIEICGLVSTAADLSKQALGDNGREITVSLPTSRTMLWGDWRLLKLVTMNLIADAVAAAPADGEIQLSLRCMDDGALALEISHDGKAPVGSGDGDAESRESDASRLGMSLITHVARLHGGEAVADESDGRTTVRVTLPAKRVVMTQVAEESAAEESVAEEPAAEPATPAADHGAAPSE